MDDLIKIKHDDHNLKSCNFLNLFEEGRKRQSTMCGWGVETAFETDTS
jgi:hypothetical protein